METHLRENLWLNRLQTTNADLFLPPHKPDHGAPALVKSAFVQFNFLLLQPDDFIIREVGSEFIHGKQHRDIGWAAHFWVTVEIFQVLFAKGLKNNCTSLSQIPTKRSVVRGFYFWREMRVDQGKGVKLPGFKVERLQFTYLVVQGNLILLCKPKGFILSFHANVESRYGPTLTCGKHGIPSLSFGCETGWRRAFNFSSCSRRKLLGFSP